MAKAGTTRRRRGMNPRISEQLVRHGIVPMEVAIINSVGERGKGLMGSKEVSDGGGG